MENTGRPPTPMPFAITPLRPHTRPARPEPIAAQSIGKRYFRLMSRYRRFGDPEIRGDGGRNAEISRRLCLRLTRIMPVTADA